MTTLQSSPVSPATSPPERSSLADLLERLGGISPSRVRLKPLGNATEADVAAIEANENRLFELVDGVLVEKAMGFTESMVAGTIVQAIMNFVEAGDLGVVTLPDGMMRLAPGLVRIPDVSFISWKRFPDGHVPSTPTPSLVPDLAVEVLSEGNTAAEMKRKVSEYFSVGVKLVWLVDPRQRIATVLRAQDEQVTRAENEELDGGAVLPGFRLPLRKVFSKLDH